MIHSAHTQKKHTNLTHFTKLDVDEDHQRQLGKKNNVEIIELIGSNGIFNRDPIDSMVIANFTFNLIGLM